LKKNYNWKFIGGSFTRCHYISTSARSGRNLAIFKIIFDVKLSNFFNSIPVFCCIAYIHIRNVYVTMVDK